LRPLWDERYGYANTSIVYSQALLYQLIQNLKNPTRKKYPEFFFDFF